MGKPSVAPPAPSPAPTDAEKQMSAAEQLLAVGEAVTNVRKSLGDFTDADYLKIREITTQFGVQYRADLAGAQQQLATQQEAYETALFNLRRKLGHQNPDVQKLEDFLRELLPLRD